MATEPLVQAEYNPLDGEAREWSSSLFGCFSDIPICLKVSCCLPCAYGWNVSKHKGGGCCGPCMVYLVGNAFGMPCCVASSTRKEIRTKYGIAEGPMSDTLSHFPCCSALALCQEARELAKYS